MQRQVGFRLRHLFVPALLLAIAFVAAYLAAVWLLVEWTGLVPLDDELVELWLLFFLPALVVSILFGPRLRLLVFNKKKSGDPAFLYGCVVALMMIVPAMLLTPSLREACWGLTEVANLEAIPTAARARYYAPASICFEREAARIYREAHHEARGSGLILGFYAAVPVCVSNRFEKRDVWIGLKYSKTLSGGLSTRERDSAEESFELASQAALRQAQPSDWRYLERLRPGTDRRNFAKAISGRLDGASTAVILLPQTEPFGIRTIARVKWAAEVFGGVALLWLVLLMIPKLNPAEVESLRTTGRLLPEKESGLWKLLLPSRQFYGAQVLFWLNVGVYLAMVFAGLGVVSFATDDLLNWGANHGPLTFGPENYGLVTSMFVHGGIMHLFNNMYGLVFAFIFLVPVAHNSRLILCYLACGVSGSIASLWWNPHVISVGASGAVLGLWGILVILAALRDHRVAGAEKVILINVAIFGGLTTLLGLLSSGIDNAAHVGGFACGLVLGVILWAIEKIWPDPEFKPRRHRKKRPIATDNSSAETPAP